MRVFTFFLFIVVGGLFLPDALIYMFVKHFIPVRGDGEYGIDNFEITASLIKTLASALGAGIVITLFLTH